MPNYAEIYPMGTVRKIWPTELVAGESDAFTVPAETAGKPAKPRVAAAASPRR
jgi:hypothetical protein